MENWDTIADAKKIPQAVYDQARARGRKVNFIVFGIAVVIFAACQSVLILAGRFSLKGLLIQVAPVAISVAMFYYLLRRKHWEIAAGSVFLTGMIIQAFVAPTTGADVMNIASAVLVLLALVQLRSSRRYEKEIAYRLGGSSPTNPR